MKQKFLSFKRGMAQCEGRGTVKGQEIACQGRVYFDIA